MGNEVIKVLDALSEKFGIVIDWTQQNIQPYIQDLCHRIVQYKLATSIVSFIVWLCVIILCVVTLSHSFKLLKKINCDCYHAFTIEEIVCLITTCISFGLLIAGVTIIPDNVNNIIQCIFLPEKVFIEEIQAILQ